MDILRCMPLRIDLQYAFKNQFTVNIRLCELMIYWGNRAVPRGVQTVRRNRASNYLGPQILLDLLVTNHHFIFNSSPRVCKLLVTASYRRA
jgi:hypothetical protein